MNPERQGYDCKGGIGYRKPETGNGNRKRKPETEIGNRKPETGNGNRKRKPETETGATPQTRVPSSLRRV
jgi:hypothetical protein